MAARLRHPSGTVASRHRSRPCGSPESHRSAERATSESCVDAELDRLYWNTDLTVGDIAELVGLPATGLNRHASPLPADVRCYLCRNELAFTSRSQRSEQRARCYACGCSRRAGTHRHHRSIDWRDLRPGGSLIVVRQSEHDIGYSSRESLRSRRCAISDRHRPNASRRSFGSPSGVGASCPAATSRCGPPLMPTAFVELRLTMPR